MARKHKAGSRYGTLIIRVPIVVTKTIDDAYAQHLEEAYADHSAQSIINYAASRNFADADELKLDKEGSSWSIE